VGDDAGRIAACLRVTTAALQLPKGEARNKKVDLGNANTAMPSLRGALATKQSSGRVLWPWIASLRSQ
jgi:hypothetical protein